MPRYRHFAELYGNNDLPALACFECFKQYIKIRGLDPDSVTLWIRIRTGIGNPDPYRYWESGSRIRIQGQES
jgi:hypothetical protein